MLRILWALGIVLCALGWSAIIGLTLLFVVRHLHRLEAAPATMRLSALVWYAPATVLLLQFSPMGLAAGLALVVSATRLLCAPSPTAVGSQHFIPALVIAAGFQAATVSYLMDHPVSAAALLEISAAMLTAVALGVGAWVEDRPPNLPRSVLGLCLTVLLALLVGRVTGGSGWGLGWGSASGLDFHSGPDSGSGKITAAPRPTGAQAASEGSKQVADRLEKNSGAEVNVPGYYRGVILWPEIKPVTALVAPLPARGGVFASTSHPLTIPFGGQYWMFRRPLLHPPKDSYFRRGTPATLFFSTTDHWPLEMEARQKLEQTIPMGCCRGMRIEIRNADRHPGTVSMEVILMDGRQTSSAPESLGIARVTSIPDLKADQAIPVPETLDFRFPSSSRLDQFDEIKAVFHRVLGRMDKSARVSIERFLLVPAR